MLLFYCTCPSFIFLVSIVMRIPCSPVFPLVSSGFTCESTDVLKKLSWCPGAGGTCRGFRVVHRNALFLWLLLLSIPQARVAAPFFLKPGYQGCWALVPHPEHSIAHYSNSLSFASCTLAQNLYPSPPPCLKSHKHPPSSLLTVLFLLLWHDHLPATRVANLALSHSVIQLLSSMRGRILSDFFFLLCL